MVMYIIYTTQCILYCIIMFIVLNVTYKVSFYAIILFISVVFFCGRIILLFTEIYFLLQYLLFFNMFSYKLYVCVSQRIYFSLFANLIADSDAFLMRVICPTLCLLLIGWHYHQGVLLLFYFN